MAYFLKKSNLKKGVYLQIYESFYDAERKQTAHRSYKALGYVNELKDKGIDDPISYYKAEVEKLNMARKDQMHKEKQRQIGEGSPERYLGYFPLKNLNDKLGVKKYIDWMQNAVDFKFNIFSMMSALVYARAVRPYSKRRTFEEVIPKLFEKYDFSLNQLYEGLEYIGSEYEKIIEIYNHQISQIYPFDTSHTYFDCTNFYFEIDREDSFRRKGPSKENRKEPIVGLGLLLDAHQIPVGMKLFPGNESEKPVLRSVIQDLKQRSNISGKTIQVADKGLNCGDNIFHAVSNGDGYIFSKSVRQLSEVEKTWVLLENDYVDVTDKDGSLKYRYKECTDSFFYEITDKTSKNGKRKLKLTEKRVVTYNPLLAQKQQYEIRRQVEKAKLLKASAAKKNEYGDSSKYVTFSTADSKGNATDGKIRVTMNEEKINEDLKIAGYNLLVTSETQMFPSEIYDAYHNLWRIEESFRVMKSQLDARPVYLQKEETITGHFLICYLAILLSRLLQFKVLKNEYNSEALWNFIHDFRVAQISERQYINLTKSTSFIKELASLTNLPLTSYFLSTIQINSFLGHKI